MESPPGDMPRIEHRYFSVPTPHLVLPRFADPGRYARLVFPDLGFREGRRTSHDLFPGEPGYDAVIRSEGWKQVHGLFSSRPFVEWVLSLFAGDMRRLGCRIRAEDACLVEHEESREEIAHNANEIGDAEPEALFTRFDLQQSDQSYPPYVHLDHLRRLIGGLLFFSDAEEEGMRGGDFALYRDRLFADDRLCFWPSLAKRFPIRHNTAVLFLNANTGFHGPRRIERLEGRRCWVYYSISSHRELWTARPPGRLRRAGRRWKIERRLHRRALAGP